MCDHTDSNALPEIHSTSSMLLIALNCGVTTELVVPKGLVQAAAVSSNLLGFRHEELFLWFGYTGNSGYFRCGVYQRSHKARFTVRVTVRKVLRRKPDTHNTYVFARYPAIRAYATSVLFITGVVTCTGVL